MNKNLVRLTDKSKKLSLLEFLKFNLLLKDAYVFSHPNSDFIKYRNCMLKDDSYNYIKDIGLVAGFLYGAFELTQTGEVIYHDDNINITQDMVDEDGHLKIKFLESWGNFTCNRTMKSFEGCPIIINGDFDCSNVFITDIKNNYKGFPLIITGDIIFNNFSNVYELFGLHNDEEFCYIGGKLRNTTLETLNGF